MGWAELIPPTLLQLPDGCHQRRCGAPTCNDFRAVNYMQLPDPTVAAEVSGPPTRCPASFPLLSATGARTRSPCLHNG